jgi:hypothetical protein
MISFELGRFGSILSQVSSLEYSVPLYIVLEVLALWRSDLVRQSGDIRALRIQHESFGSGDANILE